MIFKIFGIRIRISYLFAVVVTVMLFFDKSRLFLPTALAVFLHECAHLAVMKHYGCAPSEIALIPAGIQIVKRFSVRLSEENTVLIAGPLCNFLFFGIFYAAALLLKNERLYTYAAVQLVIGCFNLLPAQGLDGGALLYNVFLVGNSPSVARRKAKTVSVAFCVLLAVAGAVFRNGEKINISVFILAIYILIFTLVKI